MPVPTPPLHSVRLYDDLYIQAALNFIDTARMFIPIADDPTCIVGMPGYPIGDMYFPYIFGYQFSICLRDDFFQLFQWDTESPEETEHATGSDEVDENESDDGHDGMMAREWIQNLFVIQTRRWNWLPIYLRYPILFPDSLAELAAFFRYHGLAEALPEAMKGTGEEFDAFFQILPTHDWLMKMLNEIGWENARATLTRAELDAFNEIERRLSAEDEGPTQGDTPSDVGRSKASISRAKRERRFKRGHLDEMALSLAVMHSEYTNLQVAQHLGCHVKTLSNRDLCPRFNRHRDAQKSGRDRLRGGHFDGRSGRVDQVAGDDT